MPPPTTANKCRCLPSFSLSLSLRFSFCLFLHTRELVLVEKKTLSEERNGKSCLRVEEEAPQKLSELVERKR